MSGKREKKNRSKYRPSLTSHDGFLTRSGPLPRRDRRWLLTWFSLFTKMKIICTIVLLVFMTGILGWASVKARRRVRRSTGEARGCPLFGVICHRRCKGEKSFDGFCDGAHHGTCYCSEQ
nr:uncharacterized protein LOC129387301 [Dermacentor andersoni]